MNPWFYALAFVLIVAPASAFIASIWDGTLVFVLLSGAALVAGIVIMAMIAINDVIERDMKRWL